MPRNVRSQQWSAPAVRDSSGLGFIWMSVCSDNSLILSFLWEWMHSLYRKVVLSKAHHTCLSTCISFKENLQHLQVEFLDRIQAKSLPAVCLRPARSRGSSWFEFRKNFLEYPLPRCPPADKLAGNA